ncbi:MAG TPA: type II toxin-antitoxin system VapC family toxin [Candidatus Binataceae bacterium]|nr:type II toxin-antitoxin system VapC family toxin [Candidatus Binataceae bacterium]
MPRLMLDTNICIHALKRNDPEVLRRLERTRPQDVAISSVVAAELWTGVMKSRERQRNEQALKEFLGFIQVLDWPAEAARPYGEMRAALEARRRPIGAMDLLIASHAVHERAILVTRNASEFARVANLKIESWPPR